MNKQQIIEKANKIIKELVMELYSESLDFGVGNIATPEHREKMWRWKDAKLERLLIKDE